MTRNQRQSLYQFIHGLTLAYPKATVAEGLQLMLAARRLKAYPDDAAEVVAMVPPRFGVLAVDGVLTVDLGHGCPEPFTEWIGVPTL